MGWYREGLEQKLLEITLRQANERKRELKMNRYKGIETRQEQPTKEKTPLILRIGVAEWVGILIVALLLGVLCGKIFGNP